MNNKGGTFMVWIEIILFMVLFLGIVAIIGYEMNDKYDKSYDLTLGLNLSSEMEELSSFKETAVNSTSSGQVSLTDYGALKLVTTPSLLLTAGRIIWQFVSGSFLYELINNMNIGAYGILLGRILQTLYVIAIAFIFIKLVLRINP